MIWITGDTHAHIDIGKLSTRSWPEQKELGPDDVLIITGDWGGLWYNSYNKREEYWLNWYASKPFKILFLDGNHENHRRLDELPEEDMFGGKVGRVRDNIFHMKRGYVFTIEDRKFFVMGGAMSTDKNMRIIDIDWWEREIPSHAEFQRGLDNLDKVNWVVDYVITHTAPSRLVKKVFDFPERVIDPVAKYLDIVDESLDYSQWFFGHFHQDESFKDGKYTCLYQTIRKLQ